MLKVLVVDDDQGLRLSVRNSLTAAGRFEIFEAVDGQDAIEKIQSFHPQPTKIDLVILDVDMPRMDGLTTLRKLKEFDPGIIVIMMTAHASLEHAVQAVKDGAYNYLSKPVASEDLLKLIDKAIQAHTLISNIAASSPILTEEGKKIIGSTSQMQKVFNIIHRLSKVDTPVLIRGASGTGKELVARAIHLNSTRKDEKFVAINCSAIPENLFESELFGHEKGSFTGADQRKIGKFQYAEGGTLFLDEVGDMPQLMQVKILRVLQEKLFTPVGANREIPSNVRIIAATNRPLEDMIQKGTFREDLFYRLAVVPLYLPSLVDRLNDIDQMASNFIKKFNQIHNKKIVGVTADTLAALKKHTWPGNIRELENTIEHGFVLETSNVLTLGSLPEKLLQEIGVHLIDPETVEISRKVSDSLDVIPISVLSGSSSPTPGGVNTFPKTSVPEDAEDDGNDATDLSATGLALDPSLDFNAQKEAFEKEFIIKALKTFKGRINQTALHANIPKKTLLRKIEKYNIRAKDFSET
jgi:DNA-binding NtrC family response regulator